ncbi:MAG TPA: Calx-beta domain-containing protein, partial [Steroidobacteraceae bacterium]
MAQFADRVRRQIATVARTRFCLEYSRDFRVTRAAEIFLTAGSLKSTDRKHYIDHLGVTVMHAFCFRSAFLTLAATTIMAAPYMAQATSTLSISSTTFTVKQNSGAVVIYVKRTATVDPKTGYSDAASVGFSTANSSAVSGADYTGKSGQLTWGKGDTSTKSIVVPISNAKPFSGT